MYNLPSIFSGTFFEINSQRSEYALSKLSLRIMIWKFPGCSPEKTTISDFKQQISTSRLNFADIR